MEMIFQQETITLDQPTAEQVIEQINNYLQKDYYFSHFIADGTAVYENHEQYLEQELPGVGKLEIIAKTVKEFVNDLLLSTQDYTERAIPVFQPLAEAFYDNPKAETWSTLDQLLSGLQWIQEMLMTVGKSGNVPSNWDRYIAVSNKMQEEISNLAEAIENEDNILIGDLLQYELLPNFEELQKETEWTIDNEGTRHDLN
ncbi:hypothetical protein [Sporosarcina sp. FSL W7-1283]|uniref:hypothetical protein n=1 Tax=Sporosarcina sp. FSL W7-1283 TaxID=2921560 RepID=UPI0030F787CD